MSSTRWSSEIRDLFRQTQIRYPHQQLEPETAKAYLEDWRWACQQVGLKRFTEGVIRARSYCKFFPLIAEIKELTPEHRDANEQLAREMRHLEARKAAGEKFYTLEDVFREVAERINRGEINPSDPAMKVWAKKFGKSAGGR